MQLRSQRNHSENILSDNSVSDQTTILVVNAAYFVGKWMNKVLTSEKNALSEST